MKQLTKDADKLICLLYKRYLEQLKAGTTKDRAKSFGSSTSIKKELELPGALSSLDETLTELGSAQMLNVVPGDDTIILVRLTDSAIIYMENRFKDGLLGVVDFISKLIP